MSAAALGPQQAVPGSVQPGQISKQFEKAPRAKSDAGGIRHPAKPMTVAPKGAEKIRFVLKQVLISGAKAYSPEKLRSFYENDLNKEISVKDVYAIAAAITTDYRNHGYILTEAVVPPQTIGENGVVHIQVVEGFVAHVTTEGDVSGAAKQLMKEQGWLIGWDRPLQLSTLERYLLLERDLPGMSVAGTLHPAHENGAADLIIRAHQQPVDGVLSVDNRSSRYLGPWRAVAQVGLNGLIGAGDRTEITFATNPTHFGGLKYGRLRHSELVDDEGTVVSVDGAYTKSHAGYTLQPYDIEGFGMNAGISVSHPLIRSRARNLTVRGRFDVENNKIREYGILNASNDHIRSLRIGADYDWVDDTLGRPAVNLLSVTASQGLNILSAIKTGSDTPSVTGGHSDYTKLEFDFTRLQGLGHGFSVEVGVKGQLSRTTLLSAESFTLGGSRYGRGYDSSVVTGDDGIAGKAELRYQLPYHLPLISSVQFYGYFDGGQIWQNQTSSVSENSHLYSAGGGARIGIAHWASLDFEVSKPLTSISQNSFDSGVRGFVGLVIRH